MISDEMIYLQKDLEEKIETIIGKYQKREAKLLNYLIVDDEITFFLPLSTITTSQMKI